MNRRRTGFGHSLWLSVVACFATVGCGVEDHPLEDVEIHTGAVTVSPEGTTGIQYGKMWTWDTNHSDSVDVGVPWTDGNAWKCFLNSIWGSFEGAARSDGTFDDAQVTLFPNLPNDHWKLSGGTAPHAQGTQANAADAFCVKNNHPGLGVQARSSVTVIIPNRNPTEHTCFFVSIWGGFYNSQAYARIYPDGAQWKLSVSRDVTAQAACVDRPPGPEHTVTGPNSEVQLFARSSSSPLSVTAINSSSSAPYFCALTRVEGHFRGQPGQWVGTYLKPQTNGTWAWKLGQGNYTGASQYPIRASARCVR
jgi:hypothetical protein